MDQPKQSRKLNAMSKKKENWTPALTLKVTKLKAAGPKGAQSTEAFMVGRERLSRRWDRKMGGGSSRQVEESNV